MIKTILSTEVVRNKKVLNFNNPETIEDLRYLSSKDLKFLLDFSKENDVYDIISYHKSSDRIAEIGYIPKSKQEESNKYTPIKDPNLKVEIKHSTTHNAWNIVGTKLGCKYKIARVPYDTIEDVELTERWRKEAYNHVEFIAYCFNNSTNIIEGI